MQFFENTFLTWALRGGQHSWSYHDLRAKHMGELSTLSHDSEAKKKYLKKINSKKEK